MAALTRRERLKDQGRQEILEAAMVLFGEKGFHGVSMHEIAEKAGVAVGTLYNFFRSKEDLYSALMEVCARGVEGVMVPIFEDPEAGPLDKVRRVIGAQERVIAENAPYIRLSQSRYSDWEVNRGMGGKSRAVVDEMQRRLVEVFREGIERGVFRDVDPVLTAELLRAALETSALRAIREPATASTADMNKTIETLFLNGIVKDAGHA